MTEDRLGEVLCCPPLGFFWNKVFLEVLFPRVGFARWNRGGGLAAAVVAAAAVPPLFYAPPMSSNKPSLPLSLLLLLASLVRSMSKF